MRIKTSSFSSNITSIIKRIFSIIMLLVLTYSSGCAASGDIPDNVKNMRSCFEQEKYIIHACGMISDDEGNIYDYTNSREALEHSLSDGNKLIEVDFHYTSDNTLVCGHAWGDLYLDGKQLTPGEAPILSDFLNCRVQDKFSVLTFDDVAEFMEKNSDLIVVTDTKETDIDTYKMIASKYPELINRFVVQIYHASEYDDVKNAGFSNIIYTLYEADENELTKKSLLKAAKKPLVGFTFHKDLADDANFMGIMKETNTPLFVHTVNDDAEIEKYFNDGITGIYTDRTDWKHK